MQTLGFVRWPFLVPFLAQSYLAPEATEMQRVTAIGLFDAFNHYAGAGVGEHLGYLTTAVWTLLTAVVMVRTGLLSRWLGIAGGVLGVGIAAGLVEPAGWQLGGAINAISYLLWAVWLLVLGVILLRGRSSTQLAPSMLETASRRGVARVTCDSRRRLCRTRRASRSTARQSFASAGWP